MMNKKLLNILILGISSNVSQSMIAAIKNDTFPCKLYGACVNEDSIGKYFVDEFYVCPYANAENFVDWVIQFCNQHDIDIVFTGVEENLAVFSQYNTMLEQKTKAKIIVSSPEQIKIADDKLLTCTWLKNNNFNYPLFADASNPDEVNELLSRTTFPVIAKPRNGKSASGIFYLRSKSDLSLIQNKTNYILEEYLGTEQDEYTVGIYSNRFGEFKNLIIMKRILKGGTTVIAETVQHPLIYEECKNIALALQVKGPFNIQLRFHKNKPVPFEFNARFSGSTSIRALLGFKDLIACIHDYIYEENTIDNFLMPSSGKVIRYYTEKIVEK